MTIELTPDQLRAVSTEQLPVRVVGADQVYVLISEESYERLRNILELSEPSEEEEIARIREFGRLAGWDDPEMDEYQDFARPQ